MGYRDRLAGLSRYRPVDRVAEADTFRAETVEQKADRIIPLMTVLSDFDISLPPDASGWKFHCPFGEEHRDGGIDRAARYYSETNSAYCFSSHGVLTPTKIRARQWNMPPLKAAFKMLEDAGMPVGKISYRKRMEDLAERRQIAASGKDLDRQAVMEALGVALRGLEGYTERQYDADVRAVMEKALEALVLVEDVDQARRWLAAVKERVRKILLTD